MGKRKPKLDEAELRDAIEKSPSLTAALRRLGLRAAGGNYRTIRSASCAVRRSCGRAGRCP
jgi:hypothetical protein